MKHVVLLAAIILLLGNTDPAGVWKGTSICQIKESPCHDEVVVYYIKKLNSNLYEIVANKIVNNAEEYMGTSNCQYDPSAQSLKHTDEQHQGIWNFTVKGDQIDGTLMYKNQLYRMVHLTRKK